MDQSSTSSKNKSNKIRDIVRLQLILKKWKKLAAASSSSSPPPPLSSSPPPPLSSSCINNINHFDHLQPPKPAPAAASAKTCKTIGPATKFLKKTLSFSNLLDSSSTEDQVVPKGYLAVLCVGRDAAESVGDIQMKKRFVIPTGYLGHQAFALLLQEAEEEFGFQQEGILKIPCDVPVFHNILNTITSTQQHQKVQTQTQTQTQHQHSSSLPTKTTTPPAPTTSSTPTTTTKKWSSSSSSPASSSLSLQEYNNNNNTSMVDLQA